RIKRKSSKRSLSPQSALRKSKRHRNPIPRSSDYASRRAAMGHDIDPMEQLLLAQLKSLRQEIAEFDEEILVERRKMESSRTQPSAGGDDDLSSLMFVPFSFT